MDDFKSIIKSIAKVIGTLMDDFKSIAKIIGTLNRILSIGLVIFLLYLFFSFISLLTSF